jgi:nucleoside-diphosphate-sugar epimerase
VTQTIAVTGATGFIGQAICKRLTEAGYHVCTLVRARSKTTLPESTMLTRVTGSLEDTGSLETLVEKAAAVVHCAGAVRGANQQQFDRVNVEGVRRLLRALENRDIAAPLLTLSSLAAREPGLSYYAASKYKGEQVLINEAGKVPWLALRPPAVYGPGDRELLPLFRFMARGFAPLPGSPEARFSMVFVADLAEAVLAWLRCERFTSGVYTIDDGRVGGYNWFEVAAIVARLCRRPVRTVPIPSWILGTVARVNRAASRLFGYAPMLTPEKLRELRHPDWVCDSKEFTEQTGWKPAIQLEEGLRLTPGWPCYRPGPVD